MMAGWVYLPRFVDKIRLHLAGKLPVDYQENFTKGFDGAWLKAAGLTPEEREWVMGRTAAQAFQLESLMELEQ